MRVAAAAGALLLILPQEPPQPFIPTQQGAEWTYVCEGKEGRMSAGARSKVRDLETVEYLTEFPGRPPHKEYLSIDDKGVRLVRLQVGDHTSDYEPPILRMKLPPAKGDSWEWKGPMGAEKVEALAKFVNQGEEEITVPAGTYRAWKVTVEIDMGEEKSRGTDWYAPGVGIVRQEFSIAAKGEKRQGVIELKAFKPASKTDAR